MRDIVEAVFRIVPRQQRHGIDAQIEQVADGVGVFLSIQTMQTNATGIGIGLRRPIQVVFHPGNEAPQRLQVGLGLAGRRHQSAPQLSHRLLHGLGVLGNLLFQHGVERDTAGPIRGVMTFGAILVEEFPLAGAC